MTEKYEDLAGTIADELSMSPLEMRTLNWTLEWLDDNPDQVPGQTITESELEASVVHARQCASFTTNPVGFARSALGILGIIVVPDPEPKNAEKLVQLLKDAIPQSGTVSWEAAAQNLDRAGVKAPEGDE